MSNQAASSEHRAMGWAAIGGTSAAIGAPCGVALAIWGASSHLWADDYFLAGVAFACLLTAIGVYVLIAEFIGGVGRVRFPLPPTRSEREAERHPSEESPASHASTASAPAPPVVHVVPTSQHQAGKLGDTRVRIEHVPIRWDRIGDRPEPGEEMPLEPWLEDRIEAHAELARQRAVRGDAWFFQALGKWDVRNTYELQTKVAPDLVDDYYRGDGVPGYVPGEEEAYYDRQLDWLKATRRRLRDGDQQEPESPGGVA
jgi:hypothetical protein